MFKLMVLVVASKVKEKGINQSVKVELGSFPLFPGFGEDTQSYTTAQRTQLVYYVGAEVT